ncbi:MAG: calcium/sodium antiporter [Rhodothermales bacterium]|nr:calcium/sodium antiporter [Rhodothermales bacterium]MBO6779218.1 calcium/sodium antiporter [Rhodothermales bacterium]
MINDLGLILAGLVLLVSGAEGLVRGSSSLARRLGLTPLVIGLTVVAFGTSAPEMVVSVSAVLQGVGDIAVGNVVGSNIANIGLILGITALICPIPVSLSLLKLDAPVMILATLGVAGILLMGGVSFGAGAGLVVALGVYTAWNVRMARRTAPEEAAPFDEEIADRSASVGKDVLYLVAGFAALVLGARVLVDGASDFARGLGVSEATIGLTVVALGTSLPELAASIVAAIRKQTDIAVGNIIGSNIFNLLGILGTAAMVGPLAAPGISRLDLAAMVLLSVAVIPLIWTGRRLIRTEGAVLLALYVIYLILVWA